MAASFVRMAIKMLLVVATMVFGAIKEANAQGIYTSPPPPAPVISTKCDTCENPSTPPAMPPPPPPPPAPKAPQIECPPPPATSYGYSYGNPPPPASDSNSRPSSQYPYYPYYTISGSASLSLHFSSFALLCLAAAGVLFR